MCGRFALDLLDRELDALLLEAEEESDLDVPRKEEVCPTDLAPVVVWRDGLRALVMRWGFPHWQGKNVIFNARVETAEQKPIFAGPMRRARAVVPCSGFFEWREIPGSRRKQKFLFRNQDQSLLWLAGVYAAFPSDLADLAGLSRFVILTREADAMMSAYHSRMPVILTRQQIAGWLKEKELPIQQNTLAASEA